MPPLGPGPRSRTTTRTTTRADGDLRADLAAEVLAPRRAAVVDLPWVWVRQVHGATVVVVDAATIDDVRGSEADALVTADAGVVLAVHTADCAPVVLTADGVVGIAHAGWRGLEAGVIEATVAAMATDPARIEARIGPCIHAECYEFGSADLDRLAARLGPAVRSRTAAGTPALDLPAAVRAACAAARVVVPPEADDPSRCTSCNAATWFSHRARGEVERMATVVWREEPS